MTPEHIAAALTWANQNDPLITIDDNDVRFAQWENGLSHVDATAEQAAAAITAYYANTPPGRDGRVPSITPQVLRSRVQQARETAQTRRAAMAALPPGAEQPLGEQSIRRRIMDTPHLREAFNRGRRDQADDLARRGIDPTPYGRSSDELAEWAEVTGRTPNCGR
ncbi:MAG: hypothetical protein ACTMIK_11235 [Galactobacter sp.]